MPLSREEFTEIFPGNANVLPWFDGLTDERKQYIDKDDFDTAANNLIVGVVGGVANVTIANINAHPMFQALLAAADAAAADARTDSFISPNHIVIAGQLDTNIMGRSTGEDILKSNSKFYIAISSKNINGTDTIQKYGYYYPTYADNKEDATYVQPIDDVNKLSVEKRTESKNFYDAIRNVIPGINSTSITEDELKKYEKGETTNTPNNISALETLFSGKTKGHMKYKDSINSTYQLYFNYDVNAVNNPPIYTDFNGKGKIVFLGSGLNKQRLKKPLLKIRITRFTMVNGDINMEGESNKSVEDLIYDLLGVTDRPEKPEKPATFKQKITKIFKTGGSKTKITKKRKMNNKKISHKKNVSNKKRSLLSRKKVSK